MHNTECSVQDAVHRMHLTGCTTSDALHWIYNDNDNVVIKYYNKKLNVYNELNMLILKVKLICKVNINLAFKNSEKHRQAITLHCITPSHEIT